MIDHKAVLRALAEKDGCRASLKAAEHIEYLERRLVSARDYEERLRRKLAKVRHQRDELARQLAQNTDG
jgi:primosomal protein N''